MTIQFRRLTIGAVLLGLSIASSGCAMFQPSPLAEAQRNAIEERRNIERASPVASESGDPEDRIEEGDRHRAQGRSGEAMLSYLAAVRMDPAATKAKERIGFAQLATDVDRAEGIFDRLVAEDANNATAWRGLGLARMAKANLPGAEEALKNAVELDPESVGTRYALASVLGLVGRPFEALEHALKAQEMQNGDPHVANVVGMTRLLLDEHELAEESFRKAIRLSPKVPSFANNLGLALGLQGRFDEAYEVFRKTGGEQIALNNLGYVLFLDGRFDEAIDHYERALAEAGDNDVLILKNLNAAIGARDLSRLESSPDEG